MVLIVIAGMPGAGKEEFVSVALKRGFQVVRMGDVVREFASMTSAGVGDKGIGGFANEERQKFGYDIWAKRCVDRVVSARTIIDGSRGIMELKVYQDRFGKDIKLVAIHSSPNTRYPRLVRRARQDAPKNKEEFDAREERELSWGLGSLIALADSMIVNEGTLEEFKSSCAKVLDSI
ncbi:MAG TPA: AAA family ATPase [Methanomassiliicoccales archaeon]|jgi:dephospho-CoA kinase